VRAEFLAPEQQIKSRVRSVLANGFVVLSGPLAALTSSIFTGIKEKSMRNFEQRPGQRDEHQSRYERYRWREGEEGFRGRNEDFAERYGQRSVYSPDWPRRSDEASYSSDPYFARHRGYGPSRGSGYDSGRYSGGSEARRGDVERGSQGDERYFGQGGQSYDLDRGGSDDRQSYRNRSGGHYGSQGGGSLSMESWASGPHTGRGPKGYKRSDQQIIEDACQRLERDGQVDASEIEVSADDGIVRLRGTVSDRESKKRAERCVESVYGARDVVNELRVSQSSDRSRDESSLEEPGNRGFSEQSTASKRQK
jgi:osmotically-inducible protein OsmY